MTQFIWDIPQIYLQLEQKFKNALFTLKQEK